MLAKILYEQAHPIEGKEIHCGASEMVVMHCSRAFGHFDPKGTLLDKNDLEVLHGMEATWTDVSDNPYTQMIRAIKQLGSIKVWIEW